MENMGDWNYYDFGKNLLHISENITHCADARYENSFKGVVMFLETFSFVSNKWALYFI